MDAPTLFFVVMTFFGWGMGAFVAKLAANIIGNKAFVFDILGYMIAAVIAACFLFKPSDLLVSNRSGIFLSILAGVIGSIGGIGFYSLVTRQDASRVVPLTALYPALTAVLAFVFLKEPVTASKILGIFLAIGAIVFLSI